ncbi:MAG TPA: glycine C-acetyltransferase [Acetomicrobium flavidum]|uniref:glycine C-acetyltransferase n=1 Tax=Acetomicrobium flavidum TaxID=49896 RepID=UPI0016A0206D|nr:glycine C-acetyltransferase [Acetomicrobium flavidum]HOJ81498.1 glycine C-acetyltransferase [Acetomicrobium flavidum]HOM30474.1 glycine C-acetyltransferase [Acetomicrobium flavidum]HOP87735.1 glycine C-acetyltransferase [Acetomicrobium flavidum]HPP13665.1 glycine C-acetyltransferase [Acetomicrobium flavidum]
MSSKMKFVDEELKRLKDEGLYVNIRVIESPQGPWVQIEGRRVLNLCSNNYLGLCSDPRLCAKAKEYIDKYGVGPGAVRTIAGTMSIHIELEKKLAAFKGAEAAIVVQSGFCANLSAIPPLVGKDDLIFSDELNHASIIDGCRLSRAEIVRYAHCDVKDLEAKLKEYAGRNCRKLIVTDGVFSMDGDIAPLPEIVDLADKYGAMVMVDDAHGEGVLGRGGRGIVDHFGLGDRVDVEVGTLSKAFGVVGGFVAGSASLVEYLRQKARPNLFSSALTVPDVAANIAAVDILEESDDLVKKLWENGNYLKQCLKERGFDIGRSQTPITPIMVGDANKAKEFSLKLFDEGIFIQSIAYPTVPLGKARLRAMVSAAHSRKDLDFAVDKFTKVGKALGII